MSERAGFRTSTKLGKRKCDMGAKTLLVNLGWVSQLSQACWGVDAPGANPAVDLTRLQRQLRARVSSVQLVT